MEQKAKILVVEDDDGLQDILSTFIRILGYGVSGVVDSGDEAVGHAFEHRPSLVLLDVNLSGHMDGIEAAPFFIDVLDIPVIFMSGGLSQDRMEAAMQTGPVAFQEKPFSRKDLHETIEVGLATHAIRKRVRQQAFPVLPLAAPGIPFLVTDPAGLVLYASRGVQEVCPCALSMSRRVPWHNYLGITTPGGISASPCGQMPVRMTETITGLGGGQFAGEIFLECHPLHSRHGRQIGSIIELRQKRGEGCPGGEKRIPVY